MKMMFTDLVQTKQTLSKTKEELKRTKDELYKTKIELQSTKTDLYQKALVDVSGLQSIQQQLKRELSSVNQRMENAEITLKKDHQKLESTGQSLHNFHKIVSGQITQINNDLREVYKRTNADIKEVVAQFHHTFTITCVFSDGPGIPSFYIVWPLLGRFQKNRITFHF